MYEYIKGTLEEKHPNYVVIDVNGIGYKIFTPTHHTPDLGSTLKLHTSFIVKEDEQTLYGFLKKEEKHFFELLISISGIGPKLAMAIINHVDLASFQDAIFTSNVRLIHKIPGIGKKMAERLILEMKDKLKSFLTIGSDKESLEPISSDLLNALINLGYHPIQAQKAAQKIIKENPEKKDLGNLITLALRVI